MGCDGSRPTDCSRWHSAGSWCGPVGVYTLVDQYAELVLDALRYSQPAEVGKERSDVGDK